jgi:fatty acid desaturase
VNQNYRARDRVEWPTILLLIATYALLAAATTVIHAHAPLLGIGVAGIAIAQFCSLQHEVLHGHPFRNRALNEALVFPALTLTIPYGRFRDTHLAHHHDPVLTDPYDDPESNFMDPAVWMRLPPAARVVLRFNNTLLGRMVIGPLVGNVLWLGSEARLIWAAAPGVRRAWVLHLAGLGLLALWLWAADMTVGAYVAAAYIGQSLLKIRTFLEHRAHEAPRARSVIVEDRGPLALLFLNNNFHALHHAQPGVAWYHLPAIYAARRAEVLARNRGYVYPSYAAVFRAYLFRAKDPVAHPLRDRGIAPAPWPIRNLWDAAKGGHGAGIVKERHALIGGPGQMGGDFGQHDLGDEWQIEGAGGPKPDPVQVA